MPDLTIAGAGTRTMTSREIAELTGSTHDNVLKTVRGLVEKGVVSRNETPYTHPQNGQTYTEFRLSYRDTMVVVSGYSVELRAKIIDRWQELEAKTAPALPDLSDPQALRSLLLGYTEKVMALQAENAAMAPKAAFADAVASADNAQPIGEVAKVLGTGERRLFAFLRAEGILMQHSNLPMQQHVEAGRFRVVERSFEDSTGATRNYAKTLVTGKGLQFIQSRLARASITQE